MRPPRSSSPAMACWSRNGIIAIGSGGLCAGGGQALLDHTELSADQIAENPKRRRALHLHQHAPHGREHCCSAVGGFHVRDRPGPPFEERPVHTVSPADTNRAVDEARCALRNGAAAGEEKLRAEITPKNILMIGPTGSRSIKMPLARRGSALHQGRGHQVHRGRLCRQGRRLDRARPGEMASSRRASPKRQGPDAGGGCRRGRSSTCCRPPAPRRADSPAEAAPPARFSAEAAPARPTTRRSIDLAETRTPLDLGRLAEEMNEQLRVFVRLARKAQKTRKLKIARPAPAGRRGGRQAGQRGRDPRPGVRTPSRTASSSSTRSTRCHAHRRSGRRRVAPGVQRDPLPLVEGTAGALSTASCGLTTSSSSPAARST